MANATLASKSSPAAASGTGGGMATGGGGGAAMAAVSSGRAVCRGRSCSGLMALGRAWRAARMSTWLMSRAAAARASSDEERPSGTTTALSRCACCVAAAAANPAAAPASTVSCSAASSSSGSAASASSWAASSSSDGCSRPITASTPAMPEMTGAVSAAATRCAALASGLVAGAPSCRRVRYRLKGPGRSVCRVGRWWGGVGGSGTRVGHDGKAAAAAALARGF